MSPHHSHWLSCSLLALLVALGVGCAGMSRATYTERRAALYTYPYSMDEVMGKASAMWTKKGFVVHRRGDELITSWMKSGTDLVQMRVGAFAVTPRLTRVRVLKAVLYKRDIRLTKPDGSMRTDSYRCCWDPNTMMVKEHPEADEWDAAPGAVAMGTNANYGRDYAAEAELLQYISPQASTAIARETVTRPSNFIEAIFAPDRAVPSHALLAHGLPVDTCGESVPGFLDLMSRTNLAVVGEVPGTREIPQAAGRLACLGAAAGRPVILALELPRREQQKVDRYLASAGTPADRHQLLADTVWSSVYPDGRASSGVFAALDQVRTWRHAGLDISVLAFDAEGKQGTEHDFQMAGPILLSREERPNDWMVVLTGNLHARAVIGLPGDSDFHPLGWQLAHANWEPLELDAESLGGTAWTCEVEPRLSCGVHRLAAAPAALARKRNTVIVAGSGSGFSGASGASQSQSNVSTEAGDVLAGTSVDTLVAQTARPELDLWDRRKDGFDGAYYLGQVTAAMPVKVP